MLNHLRTFLQQYDWLVGTQFKSLELAKSDWTIIRKSPPWALDSWGLGECTTFLFCGRVPGKLSGVGPIRGRSTCWGADEVTWVIIGLCHHQDALYSNFFPLPSSWRQRICGTRLTFLRWWLWPLTAKCSLSWWMVRLCTMYMPMKAGVTDTSAGIVFCRLCFQTIRSFSPLLLQED